MRGIIGILDVEEGYGQALAACFAKRSAPFDVVLFSSVKHVTDFCKDGVIDLMLISSNYLRELEHQNINRFLVLADDLSECARSEYPVIYRYQAAGMIWKEVQLQYETLSAAGKGRTRNSKAEIYSIYSPVTHCGKTIFSLALAKVLGERYRTLFFSLEEYACLTELMEEASEKQDISDALFYLEQDNLAVALPKLLFPFRGFSCILPAHCPKDIRNLSADQIDRFLDTLLDATHFDAIVVDVGNGLQDVTPLLKRSKTIFVPTREDSVSRQRIESMEDYYRTAGKEEYVHKMVKLRVPYQKEGSSGRNQTDRIFWGELPDFVRSQI